ncbi:MAG: dihydropteroate synthase [Clostridiales bacterium]|jgi:cobalamin-dependent methionine synthase I|nr:dihydropteroate synthase [Clostridiales bacterium]
MIIIGEKLNSSIPSVHDAIEKRDAAFVQDLARRQEESGAQYLDINAGMFVEDECSHLRWLMNTVQQVTQLPLVIDTPDPQVAAAIVREYKGEKPIINSVTLEANRFEPMLNAALENDTGLVALCMDDSGVPDGVDRRIELAGELVDRLTKAGLKRQDIYLDPMVRPAGSGEAYGLEAIQSIKGIRALLPDVHIVCGLSNISFGLPKRALINRTFLVAAMTAGLDSAIMDPLNRELMASLYAANAVLGQDEYCIEYLGAYREELL